VSSFEYDHVCDFSISWDSVDVMKTWLHCKQQKRGFELRLKDTRYNPLTPKYPASFWTETYYYVCPHQGTSGASHYVKKNPDCQQNVPNKQLDGSCLCRLTVKTYPGTSTVLGSFNDQHSHELGEANLVFMNISSHIREKI
ncbi:hypothetical protein C8J56DRAFT_738006, partial [Mycena floridula]